jgi:hypothetical protein
MKLYITYCTLFPSNEVVFNYRVIDSVPITELFLHTFAVARHNEMIETAKIIDGKDTKKLPMHTHVIGVIALDA